MATNDFLTFAAASGANVLTQSAYADPSNTARQTGYITGTASSAAVNKTLRQTSLMSSMIGQFIVDHASVNVVDDGTITTIETNFAQAILNVAAGRVIQISDVAGLTSALNGKLSTTGNAASASKWAAPITLTLTGTVNGATSFDGSGNVSLSASIPDGALSIAKTSGLQAALNSKAPNDSPGFTGTPTAPTQFWSDNSGKIATTAFTQAAINAAVAGSTTGMLVKGAFIQFGTGTAPNTGQTTTSVSFNFPQAFPNACLGVVVTPAVAGVTSSGYNIIPGVTWNNSGASVSFDINKASNDPPRGINKAIPFSYIAFGY